MELTPNDMRNHNFSTQMRGYDKAEVRVFVENSANALERALSLLQKIKSDYERVSAQYQQLKDLEDTIRSAVMEAQKNANQIIANAKKEAELLLNQTRQEREKMFEDKRKEMQAVQDQIEKLEYQKETFYNKLRSEIEAHLKLVNSISSSRPAKTGPERAAPPRPTPPKPEPPKPEPERDGIRAEEVKPEEEAMEEAARELAMEREREQEKDSEETKTPRLDIKDDDIDAALENLSEAQKDEKKENEYPAPAGFKSGPESMSQNNLKKETSDVKKGVQDGQSQPKGYDF